MLSLTCFALLEWTKTSIIVGKSQTNKEKKTSSKRHFSTLSRFRLQIIRWIFLKALTCTCRMPLLLKYPEYIFHSIFNDERTKQRTIQNTSIHGSTKSRLQIVSNTLTSIVILLYFFNKRKHLQMPPVTLYGQFNLQYTLRDKHSRLNYSFSSVGFSTFFSLRMSENDLSD